MHTHMQWGLSMWHILLSISIHLSIHPSIYLELSNPQSPTCKYYSIELALCLWSMELKLISSMEWVTLHYTKLHWQEGRWVTMKCIQYQLVEQCSWIVSGYCKTAAWTWCRCTPYQFWRVWTSPSLKSYFSETATWRYSMDTSMICESSYCRLILLEHLLSRTQFIVLFMLCAALCTFLGSDPLWAILVVIEGPKPKQHKSNPCAYTLFWLNSLITVVHHLKRKSESCFSV